MTTIHHGLDAAGLSGVGSGSADKTQATAGQTAQTSAQASSQASGASSKSGEVQITSTAQLLSHVEQQISTTPEVNQSRVDSIRQALSSGSYQVDSGRVADGVIAAQKFDAQATSAPSSSTHAHSLKAFAATAQLGPAKSG